MARPTLPRRKLKFPVNTRVEDRETKARGVVVHFPRPHARRYSRRSVGCRCQRPRRADKLNPEIQDRAHRTAAQRREVMKISTIVARHFHTTRRLRWN
jgi:hypothetical protein